MLRRLIAALVLGLGLLIGSARAAPFTDYFTAVRDKVVTLRNALVDPLSKPQKKRKALLEKMLAAIDSVSVALQTDIQTAKTVAALVVKSFATDPDLPGLVVQGRTRAETLGLAQANARILMEVYLAEKLPLPPVLRRAFKRKPRSLNLSMPVSLPVPA